MDERRIKHFGSWHCIHEMHRRVEMMTDTVWCNLHFDSEEYIL